MRASAIVDSATAEAGEPKIVQTASYRHHRRRHPHRRPRRSRRRDRARRSSRWPVRSMATTIPLTNCPWVVRPKIMFDSLGLSDIVVLNDFEAQALAVVALGPEHMEQIGGGTAEAGAGRVVLGPGTGLGVAGLVHAQRPLDPGAGRRRPHGHRAAHGARRGDLPRISSRSRAASPASRSCPGAAWSAPTAPWRWPTASRRR